MTLDTQQAETNRFNRTDWLEAHGFEHDPFPRKSFHGETDKTLQKAFLYPDDVDFDQIKGTPEEKGYVFIFAPSGGGKSSIRMRIKNELGPKATPEDKLVLIVEYIDHSYDREQSDVLFHVIRLKQLIERTLSGHGAEIAHQKTGESATSANTIPNERADLRRCLEQCFSIEELRTLYLDHGGDPENLPKENKIAITRELVAAFERQGRISELMEVCQRKRFEVQFRGPQARRTDASGSSRALSARRLLEEALILCKAQGYDTVCVLVDIDSPSDEEENDDSAFQHILPLACQPDLFDIDGMIFKFLLPLEYKLGYGKRLSRRGKYPLYEVKWDEERLRRALEDRLVHCQAEAKHERVSDPRLGRELSAPSLLAQLCAGQLYSTIGDEFVEFGLEMGCPRAMWQLGYYLLEQHFNLAPHRGFRGRDELIERSTLDSAFSRLSRELPSYTTREARQIWGGACQQIEELITHGNDDDMDEALRLLRSIRREPAIAMQHRFHRARNDFRQGLISRNDYEVILSQIIKGVLGVLGEQNSSFH